MNKLEYRETKGFCRGCDNITTGKVIVIPFRSNGKNVLCILCDTCIDSLQSFIKSEKEKPE